MEARPYRRKPLSYVWALIFGGAAFGLLVLGLILDALPEEGSLEWNGLPLGEYGTTNLLPTIVPLSLAALACAGFALRQGRELKPWQRKLVVAILAAAGVGLALVLGTLALIVALCSSGACS